MSHDLDLSNGDTDVESRLKKRREGEGKKALDFPQWSVPQALGAVGMEDARMTV